MVEYAYKDNGVLKLKPIAMSLSQSEIDEIATELAESMEPDWQNAVSFTYAQANAGYTVPSDGQVFIRCSGNGATSVKVNGKEIFGHNTSASFICSVSPVVGKGDIVLYTGPSGTWAGIFVPTKTMNPVSLRPIDPHKIDSAVLNHWDDITSDFSTAGSTSGVTLMFAKYNQFLRELRIKCKRTSSTAAGSTIKFKLEYNGSQDITFGENTMGTMTHFGEGSTTVLGGAEVGMKVLSGAQIQIDMYNRNGSNAWEANDTFRAVIYL